MARIRTIKPDFWTDEKIMECSLSARLLFIGMWNFADDYGNLDRHAKQIKARVFPADSIDCEPLLHELLTLGLLIEYSVSEQKYLHIQNFAKHQVINRPSKPHCPAYEPSLNTHGGLLPEGNGREGKGVVLVEGSRKNGAHHERVDDSPIVETLPILGGSFEVHQSLVAELEPLCPAVDIPVTLREMKLWLVGNPSRMKTRKGVRRFISGWLTREQQKWDATQGRH